MRITDKMINQRMMKSLQKVTERLTKSQDRLASQENIKRPSDDPANFSRIMSYHREINKVSQTVRNAENAFSMISHTDVILQQVGDIMLDARNKAAAMSSDTMGAEERLAIANEVQLMIEEMLQKANTKLGGRYIFSGHRIFTQPFQEVDGKVEYMGNQGLIDQKIELTGTMSINIPGSNIFGPSNPPISGTVKDDTISAASVPPTGLDNGTVEDEARNIFIANGISLSEDVTVAVDVAGERWRILDTGKTYYVENYKAGADDNRLMIYTTAPQDFTVQDAMINTPGPPSTGLDYGIIPDDLVETFAANGITFSDSATVAVDVAGERWRILDTGMTYYVENYKVGADDNRLKVYSSENGIFSILKGLKEALESNNTDGIRNTLDLIDTEMDRIAAVRGEVGVKLDRVESSIEGLRLINLSLSGELSQIADVDIAMETGEYLANQEAYQAALEATASTLRLPSLIDFLSR